jgi:corrinoid protein of di/trimethylamine methyltransferase
MKRFLAQCNQAVFKGDKARAAALAAEAVANGMDPLAVIENGFSLGIQKAGELWEAGEYFLPELAFSAEAMKAAMEVLKPALLKSQETAPSKGTVVIGTIQGDIHDIGKSLVATMLAANGYDIIDLGADVAYARFIETASKRRPQVLCMSALLTTTMPGQGEVIKLLQKEGLRDAIKVVIGGAPASASWAKQIGADGYADNAVEAVKVVNSLL